MKLSVIMIMRNEAARIGATLHAVRFADEMIVVDTGSTDDSAAIARSCGATVIAAPWKGFGPTKQLALDAACGEWVLSLDADELVTPQLAAEVQQAIKAPEVSGFEIPRLTRFMGRAIRHAGWYPDYVLRLFRRQAGRFTDSLVHERVVLTGRCGRLSHDLLHDSYPSLEAYFAKFDRYTTLGAQEAVHHGAAGSWYDLVIRPFAAFIKHYLLKRGFLDGKEGFVLSAVSAGYVLVKYAKVRQLRAAAQSGGVQS